MSAAMEATAAQQLAALEDRVGQLRHSLEVLTSERAEAARTLARALADGVPELERRSLSDAVEALDREAAGLPGAVELLTADLPPLREAARREKQDAAEAEADRLDSAYTMIVRETVVALREAARGYLECHRRMHGARAASVEARRAVLRLAGADQQEIFHAQPDEPRFEGDEDFYVLAKLLARYGASF